MKKCRQGIVLVSALVWNLCLYAEDPVDFTLESYRLDGAPVTVEGVEDNLSGLTYCGVSDTLFAVVNKPTHLVELARDGALKRIVPLVGFEDTEGVVWLEKNRFAVLEERRRKIVFFDVLPDTTTIRYAQCRSFQLLPPPNDNNGVEGVAYDPATKKLFVVKEKNPIMVLSFDMPTADQPPEISTLWEAQLAEWGLSDLAGLHFNRASGRLLVLSDESKTLIDVDADGAIKSRLEFKAGSAGLSADVAQPEGVAVDKEGILYIVSEPNTFLRFAPDGQ